MCARKKALIESARCSLWPICRKVKILLKHRMAKAVDYTIRAAPSKLNCAAPQLFTRRKKPRGNPRCFTLRHSIVYRFITSRVDTIYNPPCPAETRNAAVFHGDWIAVRNSNAACLPALEHSRSRITPRKPRKVTLRKELLPGNGLRKFLIAFLPKVRKSDLAPVKST